MKRKLLKRPYWLSLLSAMVLAIFILLAIGSDFSELGFFDQIKDISVTYDSVNGEYNMHVILSDHVTRVEEFTYFDKLGLRSGHLLVTTGYVDLISGDTLYYAESTMLFQSFRNGLSTTIGPFGEVVERYYNMGVLELEWVPDMKKSATEEVTAFQILSERYPWYLFSLNSFGFEDDDVQAYMNSLESVLSDLQFAPEEFGDYYSIAVDSLSNTPYDSILKANQANAELEGYFRMKHNELRFAVFDRYRSNGGKTWDILGTTYPGFLQFFTEAGVSGQDFEEFCRVLDSTLTSYGSLDQEDLFFVDSLDIRLFRALSAIYNNGSEKKASSLSTPPNEIAASVILLVYIEFSKGDILKSAVEQAYMAQNSIANFATVTTSISEPHSASNVTLKGYIPWDGGAEVTSRGIAWATYYNPTTDDHVEASGTGTGSFTIDITGLTEGETYYARSYATNSRGTAYGNCIEFVATGTTDIDDLETGDGNFKIYPNPASDFATLTFHSESIRKMNLSIIDMNGKLMKQNDLGISSPGENRFELDLTPLQDGLYNLVISDENSNQETRRLIIAR